jgi:hypothetical protein
MDGGKSWQEIKRKDCGKIEEIADCLSFDLYKMETVPEELEQEKKFIMPSICCIPYPEIM